ncbi:PREDICTED: zinc finger protein OZF-like [Nanorana parkeri]|uniref:zinc finger protein OZF-like n=1 Tax=Nanorana parkeri TaxID=125878 RepID=UPI0008544BA8|nr:PREDICTED: zinc finger protein OZF-like [Nanorana parkeri]
MMEEDRSHMTERILNLTLEIIYLLTGERCPRPLYSRDSTQEGLTIPHHDQVDGYQILAAKIYTQVSFVTMNVLFYIQSGDFGDFDIVVKEEYKEEDEEYGVMEELSEGHMDIMMKPSKRNPPERCPRPLYSRDPTQEDLTIPLHDQGEDLMKMKVEGEVEETYVRDDQRYTEEAGMRRTSIEEDTPTEISTGHAMEEPSKDRLTLSPGCKMEDEDITADCAGEETMSSAMDGGRHSVERPWNPSDSERPRPVGDGAGIQGEETFSCPECGEGFSSELRLFEHQRSHTGEKIHSCSECGKSFLYESELIKHYRSHTGEKPYSCPECEQCFSQKFNLNRHQKSHTGEKPCSCPECGKCCLQKSELAIHYSSHTGEKPHSCAECEKCFFQRSALVRHQRSHTGEKPYSCPECGERFSARSKLAQHQRSHTGEKLYSCPECGKYFSDNFSLCRHQRLHTGEKPYCCPECGKRYTQKSDFLIHQRYHTREKPYSCTECGKCFSQKCKKSNLSRHLKSHRGEKPYCCPECGNCFSRRESLIKHQKIHTREKQFVFLT